MNPLKSEAIHPRCRTLVVTSSLTHVPAGRLRRAVWAVALLAFGALIPGHQSSAQAPAKVVRIILPATVGSPPDVAARILAQRLQTLSGESVIVESRPGAG